MKTVIGVSGLGITKFNPTSRVVKAAVFKSLEFGDHIKPYKTAQFRCASCGHKVYTRVPGFREAIDRHGNASEIGFAGFIECPHCSAFYYAVTNEDGKVFASDERLPSAAIIAARKYARSKQ